MKKIWIVVFLVGFVLTACSSSLQARVAQVDAQIKLYTQAYSYMYNTRNKNVKSGKWRPKLDASKALKEFKKLSAESPGGAYVKEMNELVDGYESASNAEKLRSEKRLKEIKERLYIDRKKGGSDEKKTEPVIEELGQEETES